MTTKSEASPGPVPVSYGVTDAAKAVGVTRATICNLIKEGRVSTFKIGARTLISVDALRALVPASVNQSAGAQVAAPAPSDFAALDATSKARALAARPRRLKASEIDAAAKVAVGRGCEITLVTADGRKVICSPDPKATHKRDRESTQARMMHIPQYGRTPNDRLKS